MFVKIGQFSICNADTDGVTKSLSADGGQMEKRADVIQPEGCSHPVNIQRGGTSRDVEITVTRQFASYREADARTSAHLRALGRLNSGGDLVYQNVFGALRGFKFSALKSAAVESATGVSVRIVYQFAVGEPADKIALMHTARYVLLGGKKIYI